MARLVSNGSDLPYGMEYPEVTDVEMKYMVEETGVSTVDSSTLRQPFSPPTAYYQTAGHAGYPRAPIKGKAIKKIKTEDADDCRSQSGDEEIDIDRYICEDSAKISVKVLRKIIPKLRIACYFSDEQVSGKRKLKHLWDEKPADWPQTVCFKDPNNAAKDARKPGKDELGPMYEFLRKKYLAKTNRTTRSCTDTNGPMQLASRPAADNGMHDQYLYLIDSPMTSDTRCQPVEDDRHVAAINQQAQHDDKVWETLRSSTTQWLLPPNASTAEDHAVLAPTRPAQFPREIQQQMAAGTFLPNLSSGSMFNGDPKAPAPVTDLYQRLLDKQRQVAAISGENTEVIAVLSNVQREVIDYLYEQSSSETRMCLMFLDAGHQYEALLDVLVVLGRMDVALLNNGCQEIIKKFNQECVPVMMIPGIVDSPMESSMLSALKSVFSYYNPRLANPLYGTSLDSCSMKNLPGDDDPKADLQLDDQSMVTLDVSKLGISMKRQFLQQGQDLFPNSEFIERRPSLADTPDDQAALDVKAFLDEFFEKPSPDDGTYFQNIHPSPSLESGPLSLHVEQNPFPSQVSVNSDGGSLVSNDVSLTSSACDDDQTAMDCGDDVELDDVLAVISSDSAQSPLQVNLNHSPVPVVVYSGGNYGQESLQFVQTPVFAPSSTRNVAPIPSCVSGASIDDFESEDDHRAESGRRVRPSRGSMSGSRTGKGFDRSGR